MRVLIKAEWTTEVDTKDEAESILNHIDDAASHNNCELEDFSIEREDGEDFEEYK